MYTVDDLTKNLINLSTAEIEAVFKLLTDNATVLSKIMPNVPLLTYILTGKGDTSHTIIRAYDNWKAKQ